jgi:hypothetical protein
MIGADILKVFKDERLKSSIVMVSAVGMCFRRDLLRSLQMSAFGHYDVFSISALILYLYFCDLCVLPS